MRCLRWASLLCVVGFASAQSAPPAAPSPTAMSNGYVVPGTTWETVAPEAAGFSGPRLEALRAWLKTHQTTAAMVVYKGKVVFEFGDIARATNVASVRKSVLNLLLGAEGEHLQPNINYRTVVELGLQDKVPFVSPEQFANFEQLLASRSGIYIANGDADQDNIAPKRGSEYPGTHFFYNNWDFNALGTLFEKETHKNIYDALRDDLAVPLGMQDFDRARQHKAPGATSVHPGYPMFLSTRDMARLGLLALLDGKWGGRQLIDPGFLIWSHTLATPFAEINPTAMRNPGLPWHWGYGRLWWVWDGAVYPGNTIAGPFQGAYSAMGTGGQFITVFPSRDLVVVHKVYIDKDGAANVSQLAYSAILDMVLDAQCGNSCN